jgi:hypothetical protein
MISLNREISPKTHLLLSNPFSFPLTKIMIKISMASNKNLVERGKWMSKTNKLASEIDNKVKELQKFKLRQKNHTNLTAINLVTVPNSKMAYPA